MIDTHRRAEVREPGGQDDREAASLDPDQYAGPRSLEPEVIVSSRKGLAEDKVWFDQLLPLLEDLPRNLVVPKALGMKTVLLVPQDENHEFVDAWEKRSDDDQHIDYATSNLTAFLNALL